MNEGHIFKTKIGNFTVTYVGFKWEIGIKITNCDKCDLHKILSAQKQESCKALLDEMNALSVFGGCPLPIGYAFKKIKGGL